MKIKIIKPFETAKGRLKIGTILDVKPFVAERWVAQGDAEYVREPSKGQASENKVVQPTENKVISSADCPVEPERVTEVIKPKRTYKKRRQKQ